MEGVNKLPACWPSFGMAAQYMRRRTGTVTVIYIPNFNISGKENVWNIQRPDSRVNKYDKDQTDTTEPDGQNACRKLEELHVYHT